MSTSCGRWTSPWPCVRNTSKEQTCAASAWSGRPGGAPVSKTIRAGPGLADRVITSNHPKTPPRSSVLGVAGCGRSCG
eukprot:2859645-Alexandrium_andersonii.AAC.1